MKLFRIISVMAMCVLSLAFGTCQANAEDFGLVGKVIVIDAGHGGPDSGARTASGDMEKHVNLAIAKKLGALLEQAGARVYMTRTTDDDLATEEDEALRRRHQRDLRNRTRFIRSKNPDAVVSIHCNAEASPAWHGAYTIYMTDNPYGEQLAKDMQKRFKELLLPTKREADDMNTLYLLKRVPGPVVLAEVGFLSNAEESRALHTDKYQHTVALAMYLSLLDYFQHPVSSTNEESS